MPKRSRSDAKRRLFDHYNVFFGIYVVVEVSDNGMGVPGDIDVFQLFKTTKPCGSGLGLTIVQQIVASHKGAISYSSVPGSGTTFMVRLPAENSN